VLVPEPVGRFFPSAPPSTVRSAAGFTCVTEVVRSGFAGVAGFLSGSAMAAPEVENAIENAIADAKAKDLRLT
jgi:hypothetical protein